MDGTSHFASGLSETSLRKLVWFLRLPPNMTLEDYFYRVPVSKDEVDVIHAFSKFTRGLAGEDPEAPPDEAEEDKRWKKVMSTYSSLTNNTHQHQMMPAMSAAVQEHRAANTAPNTSHVNGGSSQPTERPSKKESSANPKRRRVHNEKEKSNGTTTANGSGTVPREKEVAANNSSVLDVGRRVVAKTKDGWIMMTVVNYIKRTKSYRLEDADDQADAKEVHEITRDLVVPLCTADQQMTAFSVGDRVLANFPNTTSFYPALVAKVMKRPVPSAKQTGKTLYDYLLQFDDDDQDSDGEIIPKKVKGEFVVEEVITD